MNQFNALHGEKPTDPPIECNSQPPTAHFKYMTSTPKINTFVSVIVCILNHHYIDNGYVEVHPSEFSFDYNSESVPDPDTNHIKSIDDYET